MRNRGNLFVLLFACSIFVVSPCKALELTDADAAKAMEHADSEYKAGHKDVAISELEKLLKESTFSPKIESYLRSTLGSMYSGEQRVTEALDMIRKAHELNPSDERISEFLTKLEEFSAKNAQIELYNKAIDNYNEHRYEEALNALIEYGKTPHEKKAKEVAMLGMCLVGTGKNDEGIEKFQEALEMEPDLPLALQGMASAYEAKGDLKNAKLYTKRFASKAGSKEAAQAAKDRLPSLQKLMKTAGSADTSDYFFAVSRPYITRWSLTRMPLHVYIEPTSQVANFNPEFGQSITRAFDMWCEASEGKLKWTAVPDESTADIVVRFTADPNEVGMSKSHIEAGVCETSGMRVAGAKISGMGRCNIKLLTTNLNGKAVSPQEMQDTAAHEVGHALGMRQHSSNPEDTMFFAATRSTKNGLTQRDINTIRAVYSAQVYEDGTILLNGKKVKY